MKLLYTSIEMFYLAQWIEIYLIVNQIVHAKSIIKAWKEEINFQRSCGNVVVATMKHLFSYLYKYPLRYLTFIIWIIRLEINEEM